MSALHLNIGMSSFTCTAQIPPYILLLHKNFHAQFLLKVILQHMCDSVFLPASQNMDRQPRAIKLWLKFHLENRNYVFTFGEALGTKQHIFHTWDDGALRTVHAYYESQGPEELELFLYAYHCRYYDAPTRRWIAHNPSAAAVALCRYMGWYSWHNYQPLIVKEI
jgi:hypothetical protein